MGGWISTHIEVVNETPFILVIREVDIIEANCWYKKDTPAQLKLRTLLPNVEPISVKCWMWKSGNKCQYKVRCSSEDTAYSCSFTVNQQCAATGTQLQPGAILCHNVFSDGMINPRCRTSIIGGGESKVTITFMTPFELQRSRLSDYEINSTYSRWQTESIHNRTEQYEVVPTDEQGIYEESMLVASADEYLSQAWTCEERGQFADASEMFKQAGNLYKHLSDFDTEGNHYARRAALVQSKIQGNDHLERGLGLLQGPIQQTEMGVGELSRESVVKSITACLQAKQHFKLAKIAYMSLHEEFSSDELRHSAVRMENELVKTDGILKNLECLASVLFEDSATTSAVTEERPNWNCAGAAHTNMASTGEWNNESAAAILLECAYTSMTEGWQMDEQEGEGDDAGESEGTTSTNKSLDCFKVAKAFFEEVASLVGDNGGVLSDIVRKIDLKLVGTEIYVDGFKLVNEAMLIKDNAKTMEIQAAHARATVKYEEALEKYKQAEELFEEGLRRQCKQFTRSLAVVKEEIKLTQETIDNMRRLEHTVNHVQFGNNSSSSDVSMLDNNSCVDERQTRYLDTITRSTSR